MGKKVNLVRPDGESVTTVDESRVDALVAMGYRPETIEEGAAKAEDKAREERFSSLGQKAITAVEGAISGATLGLADPLMDDYATQSRASVNPGTRLGSEIVGALVPSFASGGTGLGATLAKTPAGLAARAGARVESAIGGIRGAAAGAALEGGIAGTSVALSQSIVNNDPITIETLLAGGTLGAALGGGAGAIGKKLEGIGSGVGKLLSKEDEVVTGSLDEFFDSIPAEKQVAKSATVTPADDLVRHKEVYDDVFNSTTGSFDTLRAGLREAKSSIDSVASEVGPSIDTIIDDIKLSWKDQPDVYSALDSAGSSLQGAISRGNAKSVNRSLEVFKDVLSPEQYGAIEKTARLSIAAKTLANVPDSLKKFRNMKADKIEEVYAALNTIEDHTSAFASVNTALDNVLSDLSLSVNGSMADKAKAIWETTNTPGYFTKSSKPRKVVDVAGTVSEEAFTPPDDLDQFFASQRPKQPEYKPNDDRFVQYVVPPSEKLPVFINDSEVVVNGLPISIAKKSKPAVKEKNRHPFWTRMARAAASRYGSKVARQAGAGVVGTALAYEASGNVASSVASGLFASTVSGNMSAVIGKIRQTAIKAAPKVGKVVKAAAPRLGTLSLRITGEVDEAAKMDSATAKKRIEEVNALSTNIDNVAFKLAEPLLGSAPELANGLQQTLTNAFKALQSFLPKDPGTVFNKGKSMWELNSVQVNQVGKALRVFHDPLGAMSDLLSSEVPDIFTVRVLKSVWPALYQEFQSELLLKVSEPSFLNSLDRQTQIYYSFITGVPFHSSATPRSIAQSQAIFDKTRDLQDNSGGPGKTSNGGRPAKIEQPTLSQSLMV